MAIIESRTSGGSQADPFHYNCNISESRNASTNTTTLTLQFVIYYPNTYCTNWAQKMPFTCTVTGGGTITRTGYTDNISSSWGFDYVTFNATSKDDSRKRRLNSDTFYFRTVTYTIQHTSAVTVNIASTFDIGTGCYFRYGNLNGTYNIAAYTTACTAPNSITASGTYVPGGQYTVSWSGASGGTNNTITGYDVQYNINNGTWTSAGSSSTTSITLTAPENRGATLQFRVMTKGNAGSSYYSGWSGAGGSVKINQLPYSPSVTPSNTGVSSSGGTITFTISGSDPDGQNVSYAYSTNSAGTSKTAIASGGSISVSNTQTYYFWTIDSLSESCATPTAITITKNTAPVIEEINFAPTRYTAQNSDSGNVYVSSLTPQIRCNKNCTIKVRLEYGSKATTTDGAITCEDKVGTTTLSSLGTYNINFLLKDIYNSRNGERLYFSMRVWLVDNYESSEYTRSASFSIAAAPTTLNTYDQFDTTNIIEDANLCWNKIRIVYYKDMSMPNCSVSAKANNTTITSNIYETTYSGNLCYLDVTLPDDIDSGASITVTVTLSDGNINKSFTATRAEIEIPEIGSLTVDPNPITMYGSTAPGIVALACVSPCSFNQNKEPVIASSNYINSMTINIASNKNGSDSTTFTTSQYNITNRQSITAGDRLEITINKTIFAPYDCFNKSVYNGVLTGYARITFTNVYGRPITTDYSSYVLNYNVDAEITSLNLTYGSNYNQNFDFNNDSIQENLSLQGEIGYSAFTNSTITAKLYYRIGTGSRIFIGQNTATIGNCTTTAATGTILIAPFTIPEITSTDNWTWEVDLTSTATSTTDTETRVTSVIRHIAPTLTFDISDRGYSRTGTTTTFKLSNITISDTGTNVSMVTDYPKFYIADTNNNQISEDFTIDFDDPPSIIEVIYANSSGTPYTDTWPQKTIKVACKTKVQGLIVSNEKLGYSTTHITIYTEQPTVAYRVNQLGINTNNPNPNSVLDVVPTTGKTIVYLGGTESGNKRIIIDLVNSYIDIIEVS